MTLALLAALCAAAPGDLLTPEETKGIEAVIASMIAAGFPDAAKSEVHFGKLGVTATFDPTKETAPLPTNTSRTQMTVPGSTKMAYGFSFDGLHVKLADGSWLISLAYRFKPKAGDTVDASNAPVVDLAGLTATSVAAKPFHAEKDAATWLEGLAPAHRARAAQAMDVLVPVTFHLKLNADSLAPAIVLLQRAGWPDAAAASLSLADQRARKYWELRPWTEPDAPYDPSGAYPKAKDEEAAWKKAHAQVEPEAPQVALRRALFRWCRAQIMAEDVAFLAPDVAAAACKAAVDPKDPQKFGARADALLAGSKLPVTPAANADLAARLQSWEARPRTPKMMVSGGGEAGGNSLTMSTSFTAPAVAYTPKKEDLDALVALLADERPSRFWDFTGPRTVGDNAWRAVTTLLEADPRTLAKHPAEKAWTPTERKAAAAAVQKWWKDHRKDYAGK
jgi:hypothetical protein